MNPAGVPFTRIGLHLDEPELADVAAATDATLAVSGVRIAGGSRVAIAAGSRGITDLVTVVTRVAAWVRSQGGEPFLVPAMGSHGGATADGQREVLESYGLTHGATGMPIDSTMDVVELPRGTCLVPVFTSAAAARADATIVVNRIKPHTDFRSSWESGLVKMIAIGLGKQRQAELVHAHGTRGLRELMPQVARQVLAHGNVVLGIAVVENALDRTMVVEAVPAERILDREPELLVVAREHAPRLPVDRLDVLLIDRMGKDISGCGMDTSVIGRLLIAGDPEPVTPSITMIGCHALTEASHGNATGVGLADVITRELADAIDHDATSTNVVTSGFLLRGKLPVVAPDAATLWSWCLRGAAITDPAMVRAARIVDTLHTAELWVTDVVLADLGDALGSAAAVAHERGLALHGHDGRLMAF
jgi:hypothetical protein